MRASQAKVGLVLIHLVYAVTLWQYLLYALYQKLDLTTVGLVFLLTTAVFAAAWRAIGGIVGLRQQVVAPWVILITGAWIVLATALYFGAFEFSACYFPNAANAARCTLHLF